MSLLYDIWNHPANRGRRLASLTRAVRWQIYKRVTGRPYSIDFHGLRLYCHPGDHSASAALYFSGLSDYREMRFILDYLRPGDTFIDIGANIGLYTLLAVSVVGPSGHVHAFEPADRPARRLQESLALNGISNVTIHRVAASDTAGNAMFDASGDDCTAHIRSDDDPNDASQTVKTVRLDDYLPPAAFAMAKLDIEGFEPFAIRGAASMLKQGNPPVLQLEMAGYSERYGVSTPELIDELSALGYDCAYYEAETRTIHPTERPWEVPVQNVLAISRQRRDYVLDRLAGS